MNDHAFVRCKERYQVTLTSKLRKALIKRIFDGRARIHSKNKEDHRVLVTCVYDHVLYKFIYDPGCQKIITFLTL